MNEMSRTLQIISIQHELAMSIGLELNLDNMLQVFLDRAKKRLSLRNALVFKDSPTESKSTNLLCYPLNHQPNKENDWLIEQVYQFSLSKEVSLSQQEADSYFYLFKVPEFGVISFERKVQPIDNIVINALLPLFDRLSVSCQACYEHQILINEIKNRKGVEKQLRRQSYQDVLTGLPNRKMLNINLQSLLNNAYQLNLYGAVGFIVF
jgi:hypothetical protein